MLDLRIFLSKKMLTSNFSKWTRHFNSLLPSDDVEIREKASLLCEPQESQFRPWLHVYLVEHDQWSHTPQGMTGLMVASYFGVTRLVSELLGRDPTLVLSNDDYARSPLWWAARNGHVYVVRLLLEELDLRVDSDRRAIEIAFPVAVLSGHEPVVNALLRTGLELISTLHNGWTALQWAIAKNHLDVVKTLLTREDRSSETSMKRIEEGLSLAATKGHDTILQLLLEYNPNIEARNDRDETPLFQAVDHDHHEIVRLLQSKGADVNAVVRNGWTEIHPGKGEPVLHQAVRNPAMTAMLLHYGAEIEAKDACGQTALYRAIAEGELPTIEKLLASGADIHSETLMGDTPWFRARREGGKDVLRLIQSRNPPDQDILAAADSHVRLFSDAELRAQETWLRASLEDSSCIHVESLLQILDMDDGESTDPDFSHAICRSAFEGEFQRWLEGISYHL